MSFITTTKEDKMHNLGLKYGLWMMAAMMASDEPMEIIELEGNLGDAIKPPEVPAGKIKAEIQDVEIKTSAAGNKYYAVKCVIDPDDLPEAMQEVYEEGAVLYWNRQVVPKGSSDRRALFNLKQFYTNIGLDNNITTVNPNDWMGCKTLLTVRHKMFDGENRAEIASLAPLDKAPARSTKQAAAEKEPTSARGRRGK